MMDDLLGEISSDNNSSIYVVVFSFIICSFFITLFYWGSFRLLDSTKLKKKAGLQPLLPPPPKHDIQQRQEVVESIRTKFAAIRERCPTHDSILTVYLEGPPGFGKTQAARLFAKGYYCINVSLVK